MLPVSSMGWLSGGANMSWRGSGWLRSFSCAASVSACLGLYSLASGFGDFAESPLSSKIVVWETTTRLALAENSVVESGRPGRISACGCLVRNLPIDEEHADKAVAAQPERRR